MDIIFDNKILEAFERKSIENRGFYNAGIGFVPQVIFGFYELRNQ